MFRCGLSSASEVLEDLLGAMEFASFGKVAYKLKPIVTEFSTLLLVLFNSLTDTLILDVFLVILTLKSKTGTELTEAVVQALHVSHLCHHFLENCMRALTSIQCRQALELHGATVHLGALRSRLAANRAQRSDETDVFDSKIAFSTTDEVINLV